MLPQQHNPPASDKMMHLIQRVQNEARQGFSWVLFGLMVVSLAISIPISLWQKLPVRDFLVLPMLIFSLFIEASRSYFR